MKVIIQYGIVLVLITFLVATFGTGVNDLDTNEHWDSLTSYLIDKALAK